MIQSGIYEHYRGNRYKVLMLAKDEPTLEDVVIYQAQYGENTVWVRNINIFCEDVEFEGKMVPRFRLIETI